MLGSEKDVLNAALRTKSYQAPISKDAKSCMDVVEENPQNVVAQAKF